MLALMWGFSVAHASSILVLGDSLTAGYGLPPGQSLVDQLQGALTAKGHKVTLINGGVSGDTAAQGAARLDWALTNDVKGVIIELGANDALRGLDPSQTEASLRSILDALKAKNLPVLILGMKAPPNMGADYKTKFDGLYPKLAKDYGASLYPFYLDGVAAVAALNQADGIHPNEKGLAVIVPKLLPVVEQFVAQLP
ncbi:MAG: arylesterase [Alphaproteobacteria bacterium]|nr:arylesterase [Alphaproteobacteria bacterium]